MASTNRNEKPRKEQTKARRILNRVLKVVGTLVLIGVCTCGIMACFAVTYVQSVIMPQAEQVVDSLNNINVSQRSVMYYKDKETGELVEMLTLRGTEDRVWVEYEDIPQNLRNATIAIEDQRFRSHPGVDWKRTAYGVVSMMTGKDIQGGSTLTQQLIKNLTQYDDVTVKRKILEIFTALEFEKQHSKDEIMEWYLNYIYLGDGCNGVYTAALNYYGKELDELTLAECASLISITQNPSARNPYRFPENNLQRRNLTLDLMCKQGMISEAERDAAKAEELNLHREVGTSRPQEIYSWYEDQVISEVLDYFTDKENGLGLSEKAAINMLYYGGLKIETCFDPEVQAYVDDIYNDRSTMVLDSKTGQEIQSGITIVDNSTGYVVALAGGIGEKEGNRLFNRATDTIRPPGSSIKPLAVYAPAIDLGLITPNTVIDDVPVSMEAEDNAKPKPWPSNSYGYYKGLTTVFEAVEDSVNTIAVRVLQDMVTPDTSYQYMTERFGFTSLVASRVGSDGKIDSDIDRAPLALGGLTDGVSTYEMAAAYATFANNGMYMKPRTVVRVTAVDINGKETVLLDDPGSSEAILKESTVYYINTLLENVVMSGQGTGTSANFRGQDIAGKTGTTTSNKDKWFVGYTPYYTAAVWVGYDRQERINSGEYLAAHMWKKVMQPLHKDLEYKSFEKPANLVTQQYCKDSGMIATEWCKADPRGDRLTTGTFIRGDQPTQYCTVHVEAKVCTDSSYFVDYRDEETLMYHLACENCPESSIISIGALDHDRVRVDEEKVVTRDDVYVLSYLEMMEEEEEGSSFCDFHGVVFDPKNPETWPDPEKHPEFNIDDYTTWPTYDPEDPSKWWPGYDANDYTTWPDYDFDHPEKWWPGYDPEDPETWPDYGPNAPPTDDPDPQPQPPGGDPDVTPTPGGPSVPDPTPTPTPAPTPTPEPAPTPAPTPTPDAGGGDVQAPAA